MKRTNKRLIGFIMLFAILAAVTAVPKNVQAAGSDFTIENGVLTKYNGSGGDVAIPEGVTGIGDWAFSACSSLTDIEIPNSVTSIGDWAFSACSSLTDIEIPNSVTSIGKGAFSGCSSLDGIEIPSSVTSISGDAFNGTPLLENKRGERADHLVIINNILVNGEKASGRVAIPKKVTSISDAAFIGCINLISITIPEGVTSIGSSAFNSCLRLTDIKLPNSMKTIGAGAFQECINLMTISIPSNVEEIGASAFAGCTHLREIAILNPKTKLTYVEYCDTGILEFVEEPTDFKNPSITIKGCKNSTAQELADHMNSNPYYQGKTNFKFVVLGGKDDTPATSQTCKLLQKVKATSSLTIKKGKSQTIKVTLPRGLKKVTKFSGKNKKGQTKISYRISDKVATVNSKGRVTAKKKGITTVTISIVAHDGEGVSVRTMRVSVKVQ